MLGVRDGAVLPTDKQEELRSVEPGYGRIERINLPRAREEPSAERVLKRIEEREVVTSAYHETFRFRDVRKRRLPSQAGFLKFQYYRHQRLLRKRRGYVLGNGDRSRSFLRRYHFHG